MDWKIRPADNGLKGELTVPPDKSISHRAVMFGAISDGECRIRNFLFSEDCMRTLEAFRVMGTEISREEDVLTVRGKGLKGLTPPPDVLYLGNAGTTMRIMAGVLAGQEFNTVLTGDESLSRRPMGRIIEPLSLMGAEIKAAPGGSHAPLEIKGRKTPLGPIDYTMPMASAQVKSCVLAAGLYAAGKTSVSEPFQSRDHTERMLEYLSADIKKEGLTVEINGPGKLLPRDMEIPGDISSASFFIAGALIIKGSCLIMRNVGLNPTRIGVINVLKRMGGAIRILDRTEGLEPAGDMEVRHSQLQATVVEEEEVPLLIDEIPILAVTAAMAVGTTVIKGVGELRVKETDRLKNIIENFSRMGIHAREEGDSLVISGMEEKINTAELDSFGDHRIAMSMAIAALVSGGECLIRNTACVDTSYPGFLADLATVRA